MCETSLYISVRSSAEEDVIVHHADPPLDIVIWVPRHLELTDEPTVSPMIALYSEQDGVGVGGASSYAFWTCTELLEC